MLIASSGKLDFWAQHGFAISPLFRGAWWSSVWHRFGHRCTELVLVRELVCQSTQAKYERAARSSRQAELLLGLLAAWHD
jgi:hypothetical protein